MVGVELDAAARALTRHQWVRTHGTPRISTLAGPIETALRVWRGWCDTSGYPADAVTTLAPRAPEHDTWLASAALQAVALAQAAPGRPIALVTEPEPLSRWLARRDDRAATMVTEGVIELGGAVASPSPPVSGVRRGPAPVARSAAEALLWNALEACPITAGRFQLNQTLSFYFGPRPVEVDLLSRGDDLVLEVDGYHHFTDPACYRRDREKDLMLQAHGYAVLRFLAIDVEADPSVAVQLVTRWLGVRDGNRRRTKG